MQIRWPCPSCGAMLRAETRHAGRRTRCPKCAREVIVPASASDAESLKTIEHVAPPPIIESVPGSDTTHSRGTHAAGAPDESQPWEENADPNAPIEMPFLADAPAAEKSSRDADASPASDAAKPAEPPEQRAEDHLPASSSKQPAQGKGRRPAVPPPKRVLAASSEAASDAETPEDPLGTDIDDPFAEIISSRSSAPTKTDTVTDLRSRHVARSGDRATTRLIWIVCGSVAAIVLVAVGILGLTGALNGPAVVDKTPTGPSVLVIDWPKDERGGATMTLDGMDRAVSQESDALEFRVASGEPHQLHLQKFGAAAIDVTIPPQKDGVRYSYKPEWKPVAASTSAHQIAAADQDSSATGDDKPVKETLPLLKNWPTDFDAAKKNAGKTKKDVLLIFFGADRRDWCYKLAKDVLLAPDFRKFSEAKFAPVLFEAKGKSFEPGTPAAKLAEQFRIASFPTLVLTDADGLAYAFQAYMDPESSNYVKKLQEDLSLRDERDKLLAATTQGADAEQLEAAIEFLRWLGRHDLLHFYEPQISKWRDLAEQVDPQNEKGVNEALFLTEWVLRLDEAAKAGPADLHAVGESLETWKKSHKFKNPNAAAVIHMRLAAALFQADDQSEATRFLKEALDCGPTDPRLREMLEDRVAESHHPVSSGTGFAVAEHGYIITNNHVVEGPGSVWVRLPGSDKKEVAAKVVAADEPHDIALLQLAEPDAAPLKPLPVLADTVGRGTSVALFGYPLGDVLGEGIKFNQGVINALPDKGRDGMYLLDCTVNPGNSGGPLCDKRGMVVGLVSAKTLGGDGVGSYGMARPTNVVADFLKEHLPGFKPASGQGAAKLPEWSDVDALVSPSVVMILKREK